VQLPEADVEAFQVFEKWILCRSVPGVEDWQLAFESLACLDGLEDMDLQVLYKSFLLINFLQVSDLRRPLLISTQKKIRIVPISLLPDVYQNKVPGSPLRKIWIRWVMESPAPEIFEDGKWEFPEEFLRELAAAQTRYTLKHQHLCPLRRSHHRPSGLLQSHRHENRHRKDQVRAKMVPDPRSSSFDTLRDPAR